MPKRSKGSTSAQPDFDRYKFVSAAAEQRYERGLTKKVGIIERGFEIPSGMFPDIDRVISDRHCEKLCTQPKPASISLVREFYANAAEHVDFHTMVRGRQVAFDSVTINKFYGILEMEVDDYTVLRNEIEVSQLTDTLCIPNAIWEMSSSGEYMKMSSKFLKPDARVWFHFLTRSLIPGTHITFVTRERMILLYCLMEGLSIDVGVLISTHIAWAATQALAGLYYPYLITSLCTLGLVPVEPQEEPMQPMTALTPRLIQQLQAVRQTPAGPSSSTPAGPSSSATVEPSSSAPAAASQQPPPPPRRSAQSRTLPERVARVEAKMRYLVLLQQGIARHIGMQEDQMPPYLLSDSDEEETDA